jgi:hypothetical protein
MAGPATHAKHPWASHHTKLCHCMSQSEIPPRIVHLPMPEFLYIANSPSMEWDVVYASILDYPLSLWKPSYQYFHCQ